MAAGIVTMAANICGHPQLMAVSMSKIDIVGRNDNARTLQRSGRFQSRTGTTGMNAKAAAVCLKSVAQIKSARERPTRGGELLRVIQRYRATVARKAAA